MLATPAPDEFTRIEFQRKARQRNLVLLTCYRWRFHDSRRSEEGGYVSRRGNRSVEITRLRLRRWRLVGGGADGRRHGAAAAFDADTGGFIQTRVETQDVEVVRRSRSRRLG